MAYLSMTDKVKLTTEIGKKLLDKDVPNSGTVNINVELTPGTESDTVIKNNSWTINL